MQSKISEHGLDGVEIFRDLEDDERAQRTVDRFLAELEGEGEPAPAGRS